MHICEAIEIDGLAQIPFLLAQDALLRDELSHESSGNSGKSGSSSTGSKSGSSSKGKAKAATKAGQAGKGVTKLAAGSTTKSTKAGSTVASSSLLPLSLSTAPGTQQLAEVPSRAQQQPPFTASQPSSPQHAQRGVASSADNAASPVQPAACTHAPPSPVPSSPSPNCIRSFALAVQQAPYAAVAAVGPIQEPTQV